MDKTVLAIFVGLSAFVVTGFVLGVVAFADNTCDVEPYLEPEDPQIAEMYRQKRDACVSVLIYVDVNNAGTGSGFFISPDGWIVTSGHNLKHPAIGVMSHHIYVTITNFNGTGQTRVVPVTIIGLDGSGDVGILKVNGLTNQTYLTWGDSRASLPGTPVYIIGDPAGIDTQSCAAGVVRDHMYVQTGGGTPIETIYTDIAALPGNSGSPVVNNKGEVVGIHNFGLGGIECFGGGTSQYIMQKIVTRIIDDVVNGTTIWTTPGLFHNYLKKGYLGLRWRPVRHYELVRTGKKYGYDFSTFHHRGLVVRGLDAAGGIEIYNATVAPSERISEDPVDGLGDWILSIDGHEVGYNFGQKNLGTLTWDKKAGETVELEFFQMSSLTIKTATILLQAFPPVQDIALNSTGFNV